MSHIASIHFYYIIHNFLNTIYTFFLIEKYKILSDTLYSYFHCIVCNSQYMGHIHYFQYHNPFSTHIENKKMYFDIYCMQVYRPNIMIISFDSILQSIVNMVLAFIRLFYFRCGYNLNTQTNKSGIYLCNS